MICCFCNLSWFGKSVLGSSWSSVCDVLFKSRLVISLFCQFYHFHPPRSASWELYEQVMFLFSLFKAVFSLLYRLNRCRWAMWSQWKLMLQPLVVFHDSIWLSTTWRSRSLMLFAPWRFSQQSQDLDWVTFPLHLRQALLPRTPWPPLGKVLVRPSWFDACSGRTAFK